jgi:hypothetical protein
MTVKRKQPYVWATWLSKVMAGEQACIWASWFKAHYQDYPKVPSDFDLARWNLEHTHLLVRTRGELSVPGMEIRVEGQNAFRYRYPSGAILAGKPDMVIIEDGEVLVLDCKTGRPRVSDQIQVQIYMAVLPACFPDLSDYPVRGRVVYADNVLNIPARAVDGGFRKHLDNFFHLLVSESPPPKAPNTRECLFCDITEADCPSRVALPLVQVAR